MRGLVELNGFQFPADAQLTWRADPVPQDGTLVTVGSSVVPLPSVHNLRPCFLLWTPLQTFSAPPALEMHAQKSWRQTRLRSHKVIIRTTSDLRSPARGPKQAHTCVWLSALGTGRRCVCTSLLQGPPQRSPCSWPLNSVLWPTQPSMAFEFAILIYRAQSSHARQLLLKVVWGGVTVAPFLWNMQNLGEAG